MPDFPTVFWGTTRATFLPVGADLPADTPIRAALVFALEGDRFVVADIAGRGWCIPGGHLNVGETPEQAVRREAREEIGATLDTLIPLGHFLLTDTETGQTQSVPTYAAQIVRMDDLPVDTESRGVARLTLDELPAVYHIWDALMVVIFPYALQVYAAAQR